jgi:hypothetical protein
MPPKSWNGNLRDILWNENLFEGMELPVKEIPNNPKLIEEQYRKLSRKLHFNFIPDEILIENLAKYAISVDRKDSALELYEYNCKNYPDSHNAQKNKSKITSPLTTKYCKYKNREHSDFHKPGYSLGFAKIFR